jgi:hypothetical protein
MLAHHLRVNHGPFIFYPQDVMFEFFGKWFKYGWRQCTTGKDSQQWLVNNVCCEVSWLPRSTCWRKLSFWIIYVLLCAIVRVYTCAELQLYPKQMKWLILFLAQLSVFLEGQFLSAFAGGTGFWILQLSRELGQRRWK